MTALPTLDDRRIDEIEDALFAEIARERETRASRDAAASARRRRRTRWSIGSIGTAAAVLVVAVAIAPQMPALTGSAGSTVDAASTSDGGWSTTAESADLYGAGEPAVDAPEAEAAAGGDARADSTTPQAEQAGADRQVIATATATLVVDDPAATAERIAADAEAAGGFVQTLSAGAADVSRTDGALTGPDTSAWPPTAPGEAWVSVRVPAASLTRMLAGLGSLGEVEESRVSRDDVTAQSVDLRARIDAGRVSVERLTALLAQAGSVADLVAAESALAERQADLESLEQQLASLDDQVALSTLTVQLHQPAPAVDADPAGFGDGWTAGWNGLIASFNGVVVALGFLLPWIALLGVAALIVWGATSTVRLLRRRRTDAGDAAGADGGTEA